ncbi:hypothetical protein ASE14_02405 [Agromyces sp. Root81]|uniref:hypothetical protein n=1 Tax=Agromyces sp. Root81 TaxID=1736601 RepID=UPI0006FE9B19|nr:hypothetical protein [Agromyces sp. Root81]KRC62695.1 hypothetical protein ASE14_02405 [Agromyces sp. Root81]
MSAEAPTRRRSGTVTLSGATRPSATKTVAAIGVASAVLLFAGCSTFPSDGEVVTGADGEQYILPDGTERPVYASRDDCIADVAEQLEKLRQEGEPVDDSPESLCESSDTYNGHYSSGVWLGPLLFASSRWDSPRVSSWAPVAGGGFAAPGSAAHSDVVEKAPAGSKVGTRAPLTGGFGSSGKGGFGSSAKAVSGGHGTFGG